MSKKGKKEGFFPVKAVAFFNLVQYSIFFGDILHALFILMVVLVFEFCQNFKEKGYKSKEACQVIRGKLCHTSISLHIFIMYECSLISL